MAAFLDGRSHAPDTLEVNQKLRECIAPKAGERLLEVGSRNPAIPKRQPGWGDGSPAVIARNEPRDGDLRKETSGKARGKSDRNGFGFRYHKGIEKTHPGRDFFRQYCVFHREGNGGF